MPALTQQQESELALREVVKAARVVLPIFYSIRMSVGLGRTQTARVEALEAALANLDRLNP